MKAGIRIKEHWRGLVTAVILAAVFLYTNARVRFYTPVPDAFLKMFYLLAALVGGMVCLSWYLLVIRRTAIEYVFLLVTFVLGLSYSLMIPVTAAPDETYHLGFTYAIADDLCGYPASGEGREVLRVIEQDNALSEEGIVHSYYASYFPRLTETASDMELTEVSYSNNHEVPHLVYLPGAVGIALGRVLQLGVVPTLMLGRLFQMLLFLTAGFFSIRVMPFGKEFLVFLSMLPMTIQEVNSFSCDSTIFSMTLVVTALAFRLAYGEMPERTAEKKERVRFLAEAVLFGVLLFLLSMCKYGALMPLDLFAVLVMKKRWDTHRGFSLVILATFLVSLFGGFLPTMLKTARSTVLTNTATPNYTVAELFQSPFRAFQLIGHTVNRYMDHYLFSAVGTSLGWYEINFPVVFGLLFLLILFFLMIPEQGGMTENVGKDRWVLLAMALLGVAFAFGGMLIGNTPSGSRVIEGVQGRYFLPFFLPMVFCFQPKKIFVQNQELFRREALSAAAALQFVVVMSFFLRAY